MDDHRADDPSAQPSGSTQTLLFACSHGEDDPERATIPFIAASVAALSGHRAVVVATVDAVWIGTPGVAGRIESDGQPALIDLLDGFLAAGGELWLCSACTTKRGITAQDTIDGATIVGAARIVEAMTQGRAITLA
jgi:predicted peroxiredoxin